MNIDLIKAKASEFNKNGQTIRAVYWVLKKFQIPVTNVKGFNFRDAATPDLVVLTTEGDFGEDQWIRIPRNIFQFPLDLILSLLAHEMVHIEQKTVKPYVLNKQEREWQAYYDMIFQKKFPTILPISNFYKRAFAEKAFVYYNQMGENSELQLKYKDQKLEIENLLKSIV